MPPVGPIISSNDATPVYSAAAGPVGGGVSGGRKKIIIGVAIALAVVAVGVGIFLAVQSRRPSAAALVGAWDCEDGVTFLFLNEERFATVFTNNLRIAPTIGDYEVSSEGVISFHPENSNRFFVDLTISEVTEESLSIFSQDEEDKITCGTSRLFTIEGYQQ